MTQEFKSLKPSGLSGDFDAGVDGSEPIVEVGVEEDQIIIACIFPGFDLSDDQQDVKGEKKPFKEVGISGTGFVSGSGRPLMPAFRRFVNVPRGCNVEVNVQKGKAATFDDILVTPAQENVFDGETDHEFEFDEEAYNKRGFYPKDIVTVSSPQDVDGYNAVLLEICPLQFNPVKKKIRGYGNIKVTLKFSAKEKTDKEIDYSFMDPELEKEGFGNLFLNPARDSITFLPFYQWQPPTINIRPIKSYKQNFLIIYHSNFKTAARKLAKWKRTKGISTQIVDIAAVGNTTARIKKYIRDRRNANESGLRYVLLFGDIDHIVTEIEITECEGLTKKNASDYYYSTPKDPSNDFDCAAPNIAIGRIPVRTAQEALDVVDQVIGYEKKPPCDPAYYDRMTFAAYFQDTDPPRGDTIPNGKACRAYIKTMESIRSHLVEIGKDVQRVYVSESPNPRRYKDGTVVPSDVKNAVVDGDTATGILISETSEGQLLIGHRDHGGPLGWDHPRFKTDDLEAITSTYPAIFFSINCLTGAFDFDKTPDKPSDKPDDCFAEHLLKMKGGAPSLIAATRLSGTWRNDTLIKALFDGLFPGVIPTYPDTTAPYAIKNHRLGDILNYAKLYLFVKHGIKEASGVKDHLEIYHVIGDPTLELWTKKPKDISLTLKKISGSLLIRLSESPNGGIIVIKEGDKIIKKVKTSSSEIKVSLKNLKLLKPVSGTTRRLIFVCFSAPGYRYIHKKVKI